MGMNEVILIITLGFGANSERPSFKVLEYKQPELQTCLREEKRINDSSDYRFDYNAVCVFRKKNPYGGVNK